MGNSPTFSTSHRTSNVQHRRSHNVLLIKANEYSDHHVSKYQLYHDNELLQCFEFLRWKLNIALLFKPFMCLSHCPIPRYYHQFLYRLTISELLFWSICITLSVFPITWFMHTLIYNDDGGPILQWNPQNIITRQSNGEYINSPGNLYGVPTSICFVITWALSTRNTIWNLIFGLSFGMKYHS